MSGNLRILIVLTGALGDIARGMALVADLKSLFPGCHLTWLSDQKWKSFVSLHPQIDRIIEFRRRDGLAGVRALRNELLSSAFDVSLDLQRTFKSGIFAWWAGAPRRIGFHRRDSKEFNWVFQTERIAERGEEISKLTHYQEFVSALGGIPAAKPLFGLEQLTPESAIPELLREIGGGFVGFVLGSSWDSKDWPFAGFVPLAKFILDSRELRVVLLGDKGSVPKGEEIRVAVGSERILNFAGRTGLAELAYLLRAAKAVVAPDSGPGHIAAAVGTPVVSLFGPTRISRTAPHGNEDLVVAAHLACMPCYRRTCPGLDRLCMRLISPGEVWKRLEPLLTAAEG